ncbi:glycosyltransferase involved in cell wall biosynthesis [Nocardioides luteus]|uniref:Glycosyltransferase WbuB n=1 Tax=Nocardioides luteus TaxID=1844 RepID=A0ABQ5SXL5_9ACTN|nr:glycosyltransferase family 4 protein [Nocardioides luteus]MDR7309261.1 glycosyltransferase involved in cell wall biosynthesis [Nocardioides luteus]GGR48709.1 glycosyltransferase WbuB [Nocardioides luteus]GLJ67666.1 glycosyltransferase WbuB [Nocardioides luteus]
MVNAAQEKLAVATAHVLIIVQNLPVPLDRRVWLECQALVARGYEVSVICPKGPGDPGRQQLSGVRIYKYRPAPQASGVLGYLLEFVYCWIRTALLANRVWRDRPFSIMQACNPPDTYWLLARIWRRRGVRFVFDQHDLNPELFLSRFGTPTSLSGRAQLAALRWLEKQTYAAADRVISTNESYRKVAITRGGMDPDAVTVVRSGPDTSVMRPVRPHEPAEVAPGSGEKSRRHTLAYLGIMGPQDGVDTVLEVMEELVHRRGRTDVDAVLMGFGDCLEDLKRRCTELGLDDVVTFTGRAGSALIAKHLSSAAIGLCPDLKTPLNDVSTMNKTMEYMAYALPSVSFDLVETRVSAEDSALFVPSGDVAAFTDAVETLLDDPELRVELALRARERAAKVLDWGPQSAAYVSVYDSMCAIQQTTTAVDGFEYVDLDDPDALRQFVLTRGPLTT